MAQLSTIAGAYVPPSNITTVLRESVQDLLFLIDPFDTPVLTLMQQGDAGAPIEQWVVDSLPGLILNNTTGSIDVQGINVQGLSESITPDFGTGYPYSTTKPRRDTNYVQLWGGKVGVTDMLKRARTLVGVRDPYNHEILKVTKVIGMAQERRFFDNPSANASYRTPTATDPRAARGVYDFTINTTAGGPLFNQVTANGTLGTAKTDEAMEAAVVAGGMPEYLVCGVGARLDFSNDARANNATVGPINQSIIQAAERKIVKQVDVYWGVHGPLAVLMCRQIPESSATAGGGKAYLLQRNMLAYLTYVPIDHMPLAKLGTQTNGMLWGAGTFRIGAANSMTVINNVTT